MVMVICASTYTRDFSSLLNEFYIYYKPKGRELLIGDLWHVYLSTKFLWKSYLINNLIGYFTLSVNSTEYRSRVLQRISPSFRIGVRFNIELCLGNGFPFVKASNSFR